ncbi:MAG: lipocalin family protein [Saprospiraceae bacterium]
MKIFQLLTISILATALTMGACKKDDDSKSARDILIEGKWDVTSAKVNPGIEIFPGVVISDLLIDEDPCDADDLTIFNADGTSTIDEGPTKCDPSDPQTYNNGSWSLSSDEKQLTIDIDGEEITFNIASISDTQLVLTASADSFDPNFPSTSTMTFTFVKK